jgi:Cu2+-exporting ATPase
MGARNGILVRNRLALEAARDIDVVIFDKTGTLTQVQFGVVDMTTVQGWDADRALALAAALEGDSEHLIAQAIRRFAREKKLTLPASSNFSALKGRGVQATLDKDKIMAAISIADVIRPESKLAVQQLRDMGIEVAMLTGDSQAVARAVANQLGIQRVFAEVLPEHKDQKVIELQQQGKRVAMVGDGVNDAPALTRADVGIAIGGGTDVAIESAGLILVNSNPLDVVKIFKLSRASYNKMIQNLWWAAGYNIVAIPLAAGVLAGWGILLSPAVGAVLMSVSTIVVAINAQLLRRTVL